MKAVLGGVVAFQPLAPLPGHCARMPLLPSPARHNSWGPPRNGHRHAALSLAVDSKDAASAIGYVIGAGSVLLYTPMIFRVARRKCAAGLSPSTWLLKVGCYFVTDIYNLSHGYPLSSFAETITLFFQALVMLLLVCYFERLSWPIAVGTAGAAVTGVAVSSDSESVVIGAQIVASAAGSCAVMPQVIENVRRGSSGEFSPVTASLLTLGNALRLWTTRELTGDPLLTAGFTVGLAANGVLLMQILAFSFQEGKSIVDIFTSDFKKKSPYGG